jgi:hypothetical protein
MWFALIASAFAQDFTVDEIVNWGVHPRDAAYCNMAAYIDTTVPFSEGFYVDFFVNRPARPAFGDWGDYWFYIDPVAGRAWYMDGREIPRSSGPAITLFLNHVGELRMGSTDGLNVYLMVPDSGPQWWDVIVNGGSDAFETNYNNNWAEVYTSCN